MCLCMLCLHVMRRIPATCKSKTKITQTILISTVVNITIKDDDMICTRQIDAKRASSCRDQEEALSSTKWLNLNAFWAGCVLLFDLPQIHWVVEFVLKSK